MLRVDVSLDLGFHVVIGVGPLNFQQDGFIRQLHFTTHPQHQVQNSFLLDVVVRLCPDIVNSICIPIFCILLIAKTGLVRCCLYRCGTETKTLQNPRHPRVVKRATGDIPEKCRLLLSTQLMFLENGHYKGI